MVYWYGHYTSKMGCNFWSKQDIKNLETNLKSAKFKVSEKYNLKYFEQEEKFSFFSSSFFIFIFELFEIFYSLNSSSFNEVLLFGSVLTNFVLSLYEKLEHTLSHWDLDKDLGTRVKKFPNIEWGDQNFTGGERVGSYKTCFNFSLSSL